MSDFRKLKVWQKANELATLIEPVCERIARRKPGLADQLERAVWAIPAAIAEGSGLGTDKAYANCVSTGIGEASEAENHLQRALESRLIFEQEHVSFTERVIEVRRMLIGLRKTLREGKKTDESVRTPSSRDVR